MGSENLFFHFGKLFDKWRPVNGVRSGLVPYSIFPFTQKKKKLNIEGFHFKQEDFNPCLF